MLDTSNLSYTNRDVASIRRELIGLVPNLTTKWTDFNESDLGVTIVELIAGAQDMQNFYLDSQAYETYLDTAVQDKNVRSLLRSMNYRVPLMTSARGTLRITFVDDSYKEVNIPKYTVVHSGTASFDIKYSVTDTVIQSGNFDYIDVPIVEGELHTITMLKSDLLNNKNSNSNVSRRIYLGFKNVADRSVSIEQENEIWEECDDALLKFEGGFYYSVHKDSEGQVYLLMSVNFLDLIPEGGSITISFLTSSGTYGVVAENVLDTIDIVLEDVVRIYNTIQTYGATDEPEGDDLQGMKLLARRKAVTMGRYITLEDYKQGVDEEPCVFQSVVKDWKYPEYVNQPYLVKIWAVDTMGNSIGQEYRKIILDKLYSKCDADMTIEFSDVENVNFDLSADVILSVRTNSEKEKIKQEITDYLNRTYRPENMSFGENISYSILTSRIKAVSPYVKDVLVTVPSEDIEVGNTQFPKLRSVSIRVVDKFEE